MILINLLPHRELARKRARQVFNASLAAAALAGALVAGAVYLWYQHEIAGQQARNALCRKRCAPVRSGALSRLLYCSREAGRWQRIRRPRAWPTANWACA